MRAPRVNGGADLSGIEGFVKYNWAFSGVFEGLCFDDDMSGCTFNYNYLAFCLDPNIIWPLGNWIEVDTLSVVNDDRVNWLLNQTWGRADYAQLLAAIRYFLGAPGGCKSAIANKAILAVKNGWTTSQGQWIGVRVTTLEAE